MIRCFKVKCSVSTSVSLIGTRVRKFYFTPKSLARSVSHRNQRSQITEKNTDNNSPSLTPESSNVNFLGIESDEGVITLASKISCLHEKTSTKQLREKFYTTSYGVIRYDTDNKLKFHGQYGKRGDFVFPHRSNDVSEVSKNFIDMKRKNFDQLHYDSNKSSSINTEQKSKLLEEEISNEVVKENSSEDCREVSYIDQFYFETSSENVERKNAVADYHSTNELNYFDNEYFGRYTETGNRNRNLSHELSDDTSFTDKSNSELNSDIRKDTANNLSTSLLTDDFKFIDKNYFEESNVNKSFDIDQSNVKNSDCDLNMKQLDSEILRVEEISQNTVPFNSSSSKSNQENLSIKSKEKNKAAFFNFNFDNDKKSVSINNCINNEFKTVLQTTVNKSFDNKRSNVENSDCDLNIKQLESRIFQSDKELNFDSVMEKDLLSNVNYPEGDFKRKINQDSNLYSNVPKNNSLKSAEPSQSEKNTSNSTFSSKESTNTDNVTTAYDFVKNLHKQQEVQPQNVIKEGNKLLEMKVDSKGFRILKDQVKNLSNFTRDEILCLLKKSILYQDDNLLILNKPYSLVIHDSQTTKTPCLSSFLEDLAKEIDDKNINSKLVAVHRLDKETTGCLLIARNETMAQNLQSLFAQRKIIKKYWVLTSKVPDPPEGLIDIPIAEGSVDNKRRMVLHPEISKDIAYRNHSRKGKQALTSYKVLSQSGNAALVEATPITGIKHQIRVHFGFGLSCPIIGDHKYSHLDKLAPQKLPSDILQRLYVRQSKVRYIPLHIHAKSVTIPGYFEDRDLYIQAPLPNHMKENLKKLKFKKK